jgi:hypothetical protein
MSHVKKNHHKTKEHQKDIEHENFFKVMQSKMPEAAMTITPTGQKSITAHVIVTAVDVPKKTVRFRPVDSSILSQVHSEQGPFMLKVGNATVTCKNLQAELDYRKAHVIM